MKHEYSLAHLTVLSLTPPQLVDVAARTGYEYVGVRITRVTPQEVLYDLARDRALMIHEVDNLRAMVGEIVAVQALLSNATRGFEVEDTVAIGLRFANGTLGTFLLSDTAASPKSWEQTSRENTAYAACDDEDAYTLVGTRGSLGVPTMFRPEGLLGEPEERKV